MILILNIGLRCPSEHRITNKQTKYDPYKQALCRVKIYYKAMTHGSELLKNHKTWLLFIFLLPLGLTYSSPWLAGLKQNLPGEGTNKQTRQNRQDNTVFYLHHQEKYPVTQLLPGVPWFCCGWSHEIGPPHITKNLLFWPERRPCRSDSSPHHHKI